jgi:hypothetical protein
MPSSRHANPLIYLLVCWFGSAPWLGPYSAWVEMSIFTQHLPEGWSLGSVLIVTIQVRGSILYPTHKILAFRHRPFDLHALRSLPKDPDSTRDSNPSNDGDLCPRVHSYVPGVG